MKKISYEPFFDTKERKGISTYKLFKCGLNSATYYRIRDGKSVSLDTVGKLCEIMQCEISDIIKCVSVD